MKCKQKIVQTICSESALDAVSQLVAGGMKVAPACRLVVEEYTANHPEENVKVDTLRRQYNRAQKTTTITTTKPKKLEVPIVMNAIDDFPFEAKIGALEYKVSELEKEVVSLKDKVDLLDKSNAEMAMLLVQTESTGGMPQNFPSPTPQPQASQPYSMPRSEAFITITKYGNTMMQKAIKMDNLTNERLYDMIKKVRQDLISSTPGGIIDPNISNCVEVID